MKELLKRRDQLKALLQSYRSKIEAGEILSAEEQSDFDAKLSDYRAVREQIVSAQAFDSLGDDSDDLGPVASAEIYASNKADRLPNHIPAPSQPQEPSTMEEFLHMAFYDKKKAIAQLEYRAEQRMDTGSKGGFVIPTRLLSGIREYARTSMHVRSQALVIPAGTPPDGEVSIPALDQEAVDGVNRIEGGVEVTWIDEGAAKNETDANFRTVNLRPYEVAAIIPLTDKLIRNAGAMVAYVSSRLNVAVSRAEEKKFFTGSGVGTPTGFIESAAALTVARTTGGTISFADIKAMEPYVYDPAGTAKWYGNRAVKAALLSLVGDGGGATNIIRVDASTGEISIYGRPFMLTPFTKAIGTKGDFCLVNFSEYLIKDGSGPIVETGYRSNDWAQNKTSVKITMNVDAKPFNLAPFAEEDDVLISPFVVLDVPAIS